MKKGWKQWISAALVVVLLFSMPIFTYAEESVEEWTYDNSIVVSLSVPEFQTFEPEDFPEINCSRVVVADKETLDDGIHFLLVLVLRDYGQEAVEKALEIARKDQRLLSCNKNERYTKCKSQVLLNHSEYVLKIGETVDLQVVDLMGEGMLNKKTGVFFQIDPSVIDNDTITKTSFEKYGVFHFWPCHHPTPSFSYPNIDDPTLEGCKSATSEYYALSDETSHAMEMVDQLAREPGILYAKVTFTHDVPTGPIPSAKETWKLDQPEIAKLTVSEESNWNATVQGLRPGTVTLTMERETYDSIAYGTCTITVVDEYCKGDINRDADIDARDALLALQHSVELIALDEEQKQLADMDDNNIIDAADALNILQISVGLLP